jgi:DNA-binding CsgD family transcriptional regulator/PAS domain-containing protein
VNQQDRLLALIDDVYAAPGTDSGWPVFLDSLCAGVNGSGASFIAINSQDRRANVTATVRTDPEALKGYQAHWGALDPWGRSPKIAQVPAATVIAGDDLISHSAVKQTAFYYDFGRQYDIVRCLVGMIETGSLGVAVISINGTERRGSFASEDSALLAALMPHLQRGLQLHRRFLTSEAIARDFAALVDFAANAVILVNRASRVTFMNRAAERLVSARDGLTVDVGELRAARSVDTERLRSLITDASAVSKGQGIGSGGALAVQRPSGGKPLMTIVSPVSRNCVLLPDSERAVAMVVIAVPDHIETVDEELLRTLFGITRSEAKLLRLLVQGVTLADAASHLSLARETVRSRVKDIFEKTNTHGQSELIALVLKIAQP